MVFYFWSEEAEKAWKNIGLQYPITVEDARYQQFHQQTKHSPAELNFSMIQNLRRILVNEKEFIVHDLLELRCDNLGNEKHFYRSNIGMYSIPIPQFRIVEDSEGYKEKKAVGTAGIKTGYSTPFTKENVEKLVKKGWVLPEDPKEVSRINSKRQEAAAKHKAAVRDITGGYITRYSVGADNDRRRYTVPTYKDWLEGTWDELRNFGKAHVSKDDWERKRAIDEVAAAAKEQGNQHILEDINNALNKNRTEEALYK